jgi:DNA gyrase subunit B
VDVTVWRNGQEYKQSFEFGKSIKPLNGSRLSSDQKGRTGTRVKFLPDKQGK